MSLSNFVVVVPVLPEFPLFPLLPELPLFPELPLLPELPLFPEFPELPLSGWGSGSSVLGSTVISHEAV